MSGRLPQHRSGLARSHARHPESAGAQPLRDAGRLVAPCARDATKVARAQVAALGATGVQLRQNNSADGEQSVFHLHLHVIPRYPGVPLRKVDDRTPPTPTAELAPIAAKLGAAIGKKG